MMDPAHCSPVLKSLNSPLFTHIKELRSNPVARADPAPRPYLQQALTLARFEPGMYEIVRAFSPFSRSVAETDP